MIFQADYLETDYEVNEHNDVGNGSSPPRTPRFPTPVPWDDSLAELDYLDYLCTLDPNYVDIDNRGGFGRNLSPSPSPVEYDPLEIEYDEVFLTGDEVNQEGSEVDEHRPPSTPPPEDPIIDEIAVVPAGELLNLAVAPVGEIGLLAQQMVAWAHEFGPPLSPPFHHIADEVWVHNNEENGLGHSDNEYSPPPTPRFDRFDDDDDDVFLFDFPIFDRARG